MAKEIYSINKLSLYQTAHMNYPYTLPQLDYAYDALEPHLDEQTMHSHHDKQAFQELCSALIRSNG